MVYDAGDAEGADADAGERKGRRFEARPAPPRLDYYLLAEEILTRLPPRFAAACAVGALRGILTDLGYWRHRNRRLPRPRAACLLVGAGAGAGEGGRLLHEFHFHHADAAVSAEPAAVVRVSGGPPSSPQAAYRLAGACNGLVLLAAPWSRRRRLTGVLFNPASGEEETVAVNLLGDGGGGGANRFWRFCALGYAPSSKAYKALACASAGDGHGELLAVPFAGAAAAQRPRTVALIHSESYVNPTSLTSDDGGEVYILAGPSETALLIWDVAGESASVTAPIPIPPTARPVSVLMELWGRPCVALRHGCQSMATSLWVLSPEHRWERRCRFAVPASHAGPRLCLHGAWDCGGGRLFGLFRDGRRFTADIGGAAGGAGAHRRVRVSPRQPEEEEARTSMAELQKGTFCWGYTPTLVRLASVFGDGEGGGAGGLMRHYPSGGERRRHGRKSRRCLEALVEMMTQRPPEHG
ncbi:hypothetical protein ACP4OV_015097 [Aristida adscensionis]